MSYIFLGTKHVNSFGSSSQFHVDYYYEKYRTAAKMYYRMKTILKYTNTTGGTGFYNDPIHVNFQINYDETDESKKYNQTFALKPANTGTLTNGMTWTAESSWFGFEKLTGNTPAKVSVNNSNTYGFDSPDNYFSLPIDPAMSTMIINNNQEFDVDTDENISNTIPVSITKYDDIYTHKLKITIQNTENVKTVVRETSDFNDVEITFNENELSTIYTNADKSSFKLIFELFTYSDETLLGSVEMPTNANLSSTNLKPTLTTTFEETNPKVIQLFGSSADTIVQNASKLKITVNPVAHKQSTVNEVQFLHNQLQVSKKETPFEHQVDVKNSVFSITVVDSRSEKTTIEYTKNIIEYVPIEISNYSFKRVSSTSSNVKLNAIIRYKQVSFNDTPNVPTMKWKLNDGDYATLTSDDYTIDTENNQIIINNLILENVLSYMQKGTFYLEASDLLTDDAENSDVLKGIPTYDYGEHDLQINGNLFIADENRVNKINVKDYMKNLYESLAKKSNYEYLRAGISVQQDVSANYIVKLNKEISKETDKLILSDDGIKINSDDVSIIEVSGNMMIGGTKTVGAYIWGRISLARDGEIVDSISANIQTYIDTGQYWCSTPLVAARYKVKKNDVIKLVCDSLIGGFLRVDNWGTFLEVRIIK